MSHLPYAISYHRNSGIKKGTIPHRPISPSAKSFRRDILEGYLFCEPNQIIDLGEKRDFRGIYPCPYIRTSVAAPTSRSPDTAAVPPPSSRSISATSTPAGNIDNKRANLVLKALSIAVRNSRNVYFHIRQDDMVRQVPNYAQQYLTEHPELNPPDIPVAPEALVQGAEPSPAASNPNPEAKPTAPNKLSHEKDCHPVYDNDGGVKQKRDETAPGPLPPLSRARSLRSSGPLTAAASAP